MVSTEHGAPAIGALLEGIWNGRRADSFDQMCRRG
jgi:hypothetical protein